MVTMDCNITFDKNKINSYLDELINRIFAILAIYEDCEKSNNFQNYLSYLNRIIVEVNGVYNLLNIEDILSIIFTLEGMTIIEKMKHGTVKSLTFHCISIIKKVKVK